MGNRIILRRLFMSKINRPPVSIAKIARQMKKSGREGKIIVIVGTVTNDDRIFDCPKIKLAALHVTEKARERILKAGGVIMTFDQLALAAPTGKNTLLLQGARHAAPTSSRWSGPRAASSRRREEGGRPGATRSKPAAPLVTLDITSRDGYRVLNKSYTT